MLRIGDGGTQRMATGEHHLGSNADEDLPSSSSRVNVVWVIMWLRPIREPRTDAFWKKFSFPPNARVFFSSSRPRFVTCTKEDREGMNFMYCPKVHISEGLRFPLPPLVHQFSTLPVSIQSIHT